MSPDLASRRQEFAILTPQNPFGTTKNEKKREVELFQDASDTMKGMKIKIYRLFCLTNSYQEVSIGWLTITLRNMLIITGWATMLLTKDPQDECAIGLCGHGDISFGLSSRQMKSRKNTNKEPNSQIFNGLELQFHDFWPLHGGYHLDMSGVPLQKISYKGLD